MLYLILIYYNCSAHDFWKDNFHFFIEETASSAKKDEAMEVEGDEDYSEVMNDPAFLQSVLENLPGVDPQSETIRQAVGYIKDIKKDDKDDKQKK